MNEDKVKQKLREYLKNGQLNELAGQIIAEMSDEEAQQVQKKFNKIFKAKDEYQAANDKSSDDPQQ